MRWAESADGTGIAFRLAGVPDRPTILFIHSIGCDHRLWDSQMAAFAPRHQVVALDVRGHGRSDAPTGDYAVAQLGADALAVLDAVGAARAHICGLSIGGTVALWLALHAPERLASIALCNSSARLGTREGWQSRADTARASGMAALVDMSMSRFFSAGFRASAPETVGDFRETFLATPPHGFAGCCAVLRDADFGAALGAIAVPALVLAGLRDEPVPPAEGELLAGGIPAAALAMVDTGHISAVENAQAVNDALRRHFDRAEDLLA